MRFGKFEFGAIEIDGTRYDHDVVIDRGSVRKRKKKPSKKFREQFGYTPISIDEHIPWRCDELIIGTGMHGALPLMKDVVREAERRHIHLLAIPTTEAIKALARNPSHTNAILHATC